MSTSSDIVSRSIVVEGDAQTLERQKKQADIRGFTIMPPPGIAILPCPWAGYK